MRRRFKISEETTLSVSEKKLLAELGHRRRRHLSVALGLLRVALVLLVVPLLRRHA